jgi:phenylpropionate dioxygenase-like ring-hydroxylating dioxygenase large terminal subunit
MLEAAANLSAKPTDDALSRLLEKLSSVDRLEHEVQLLREQVEKQNDLMAELVEARALPPGATPERIDRALEVELLTENEDSMMVKAVRWLERRLRRK